MVISNSHVLVTGGAGFIGSHTVDLLMSKGCRVSVLDNLSTGRRANLTHWQSHPSFAFAEGDVRQDIGALLKPLTHRLGPIDRIVHLAAQTAVGRSIDDPLTDIAVNLSGTVGVLEYARRNAVAKVVFASSAAVYGNDAVLPVVETLRPRPTSPYGVNKLAVEFFLDYYMQVHALPFTAVRFMNVYGPRQDPSSWYSGVISIFLDHAVEGRPITIFDDGEQTRDFVYVADVASAVVTACLSNVAAGEVVNIGTGVEVTVNQLVHLILELTGSSSLLQYAAPRAGDIRRSVASIDKALALLAYRPQTALREGLRSTLAWVREMSVKQSRPAA